MRSDTELRAIKAENFPFNMTDIELERWLRIAELGDLEKARGSSIVGDHPPRLIDLIIREQDRRISEAARNAAIRSIPAPWFRNWAFWLTLVAALAACLGAYFAFLAIPK